MKVLFVSSEVVPFSKTGGLADVAGALPQHLRNLGVEVRTVTPLYGSVPRGGLTDTGISVSMSVAEERIQAGFFHHKESDTWFVDIPKFFERKKIYTTDSDEHLRFAVFGWAALALCRSTRWSPDVVHCNDWQTGLVPVGLKLSESKILAHARSVMTIHNLGYQGNFDATAISELGAKSARRLFYPTSKTHREYSFLGTGIKTADTVTTVSPTYAKEIQTPGGGAGLDTLLREKGVTGILNGIDSTEWNPGIDHHIAARYSAKSLHRKELCKQDLLERSGLPYRKGVPVVGMVSRLVDQKGLDIIQMPLIHFLETWDLRVVILGSGETKHVKMLSGLQSRFPAKLSFTEGYDNALSHKIEAGSDIFLMPSLYEPCGLNQMYSLAYGTLPVVRRTGGLADTVKPADVAKGTGTGFVFEHYTNEGVGWALGEALRAHMDVRGWRALQGNAMIVDNSWTDRARQYLALYEDLLRESPLRNGLSDPSK